MYRAAIALLLVAVLAPIASDSIAWAPGPSLRCTGVEQSVRECRPPGDYEQNIMGSWDHTPIVVADLTGYSDIHGRRLVHAALSEWFVAILVYSEERNLQSSLGQLGYRYIQPVSSCEGGCPDPMNADIVVQEADTGWCVGCAAAEPQEGRYRRPMVVNVPPSATLTDADMYNYALHELGHAIALGHSDMQVDATTTDAMTGPPWDQTLNCVTTLNLAGIAAAYAWIPSETWSEPPEYIRIGSSHYRCI